MIRRCLTGFVSVNVVRLIAAVLVTWAGPTWISAAEPTIGTELRLTDSNGKQHPVRMKADKATVVIYISRDCPMSNGYLPKVNQLAETYKSQGVRIVAINPMPDDTTAQIREHATEYKLKVDVLCDPKGETVRLLKPKVVPEAILVDGDGVIRYRGRIDDGYVARMKPKAQLSREDLKTALDELLAGKEVSLPETRAFGCPVPGRAEPVVTVAGSVTYHKDIAPILQAHCQSCHRPGQVGPFSLLSFKDAARWGELCWEEINSKRMPPWKAADNHGLADARTLPAPDRKLFGEWIEQGMPEGNPKDAPKERQFRDDWTLGKPDLILEVPDEITIGADGRDHFRVVAIPTGLTEDKYIKAMEVRPGNPRVVHHTLQLIDTSGQARKLQENAARKADPKAKDRGPGYEVQMGWGFLPDRSGMAGGWAPGMLPKPLPNGIGQKLPKGSDLCVQFHFHRTGKVEKDRTRIGIYFAKEEVTQRFRTVPVAGLFTRIPAGDKDFRVTNEWTLSEDIELHRLTPHMHMLGKDIELTARKPGATESTSLIRIPHWDYNWQEQYAVKEPVKLPKGTVLKISATFDNSSENPHNPFSPPQAVRLGEQTTNEMCFVFLGISSSSATGRLLTPKGLFGGGIRRE